MPQRGLCMTLWFIESIERLSRGCRGCDTPNLVIPFSVFCNIFVSFHSAIFLSYLVNLKILTVFCYNRIVV